jgi:hypothetical protein
LSVGRQGSRPRLNLDRQQNGQGDQTIESDRTLPHTNKVLAPEFRCVLPAEDAVVIPTADDEFVSLADDT